MKTLDAFDRQFPTEEACREYLVQKRWPNGVSCPRCGATERVYKLRKPFHWQCKNIECGGRNGYRFSVLTLTIFQDTKVPLKTWFRVGYLMLTAKKGISALQVHRVVFGEDSGSDYPTSWYMCHRWRAAMRGEAFPLGDGGIVEVDETYIGGSDRNRHKGKKSSDVRAKTQTSEYRKPGESVGYLKTGSSARSPARATSSRPSSAAWTPRPSRSSFAASSARTSSCWSLTATTPTATLTRV